MIRERGGPAFSEEEERGGEGEGGGGGGKQPLPAGVKQTATTVEGTADGGQPEQGVEVGREVEKEAAFDPDHPNEI